jgi:hypothetical protein
VSDNEANEPKFIEKTEDSIAKQEVCIAKQEDNIQLYE